MHRMKNCDNPLAHTAGGVRYCVHGRQGHHPPPTMTKQQAISALILAEVAKGRSIQDAFDAVIGAGAYAKLAGEVWEALQSA